jgi:hypothetical protein
MTATDSTRRLRDRTARDVEVTACACAPDQPCLFHYDQLDPGRQAAARRRAGIHEPYLGARR